MLASEGSDISLTGLQGNQSAVAGVGDGDNSLSMRRVKSSARDQTEGWHNTALARAQSCKRSCKPFRPPLMRRVMLLN